ncbi:MAG: YdcH family protein [Bryobacterales bacterium]|jgi:hypothetical protein|nr:YdcH family protein [Bryobacterales bacterium]
MGIAQDELKAHLMESNEEFRRLAQLHSEHSKRIEELSSRSYVSAEDQLEEVRLKKMKLRLKDQMEAIMSRYRAQQVA